MWWKIAAAITVCAALWLLYVNGYAVTQVKTAVKYIESSRGRRASFSACSGFTRRRVNFGESRTYHFVFAPDLTKGEVYAELLDRTKQPLLRLTEEAPCADVQLEKGGRYYLVFRFQSASGRYALSWD